MRSIAVALAIALACFAPSLVAAKGGSGHSHHATAAPSHSHSKAVPGVHRDAHGKIARDPRQANAFKKQHPCPSTGKSSGSCPGYVIDHVIPLKRGGADSPGNMQWQTKSAAREKDQWE
jgi:hypothetical protein